MTQVVDQTIPSQYLNGGNLPVGTGIPGTHASWVTSDDSLLAMKIHHRGGADYIPTSVSPDGTINYDVLAGSQPGNPTRAEWNFAYLIGNLKQQDLLNHDQHFQLRLDSDPGPAVRDIVFDLGSDLIWHGGQAGGQIADDGHKMNPNNEAFVLANSENLAFWKTQIGPGDDHGHTDMTPPYNFGPGIFDIHLVELVGTTPVADLHLHVTVG